MGEWTELADAERSQRVDDARAGGSGSSVNLEHSGGATSALDLDRAWPRPNSMPAARPDMATVPLEESVALYDDVGHALVMLNASASAVWSACNGKSSFEEIVRDLAAVHDVSPDAIREDVWRTLHELASIGLVADSS